MWRQLTRGFRVLTNRTAADQDIADEVQHYVDEATRELMDSGLSAEDARRAAARAMGGSTTVVRERVRSYGWENVIIATLADLRYAARALRKEPGFAAANILTFALGIGACTAILSAVRPILVEPLPYPHADRVITVSDFSNDGSPLEVTFGTYREVVDRSRSFDAIAVMKSWQPTVLGTAQPERLDGQRVTAGFFRALGVLPAFGRDFHPSEDVVSGPNVVILSDGLWRRRFSADPGLVGRQITLNDTGYTVVGVMPRAFENVVAQSAELWAPLQYDASLPELGREWGHHLRMVARLRAGIGIEQARVELNAIARAPIPGVARPPWASLERGFIVTSLQDDVTRGVRPALLAVLVAVMLVLASACVNVTNLLLARSGRRRGEFAMRAALGAGRLQLIRHALMEGLLLAMFGGAVGMVVAAMGVHALVAISPPGVPRLEAIGLDGRVFTWALAITATAGLLVGLIPALQASRPDLRAGLAGASRSTSAGHQLTRRTLVVAEVALAVVLLACAGLLLRSLQHLFAQPVGFDAAGLLTMQVQTSGHRFEDDRVTHRFFADALEAVREVPGVAEAGFTSQLPLSGSSDVYGVHFGWTPAGESDADTGAFRYAVTPGYLETMRVPLKRGRVPDAHDAAEAARVGLISESLARSKFADVDPIGRRIRVGPEDSPWTTIVGVVGDVRQTSLAVSQPDAVYIPNTQWRFTDRALWLVVRSHGDPAALTSAVRQAIWSVNKDQPIVRVATMEQLVTASVADRRFALILFEAFAVAALFLAVIGIYGVLSGSVTERTREIGVRSALGASHRSILALVLGQGITLTAIGVGIGLLGALAATRMIATLLFGVSAFDPITYVGVIALLGAASVLACWVPAQRAAWVDPAVTLRAP